MAKSYVNREDMQMLGDMVDVMADGKAWCLFISGTEPGKTMAQYITNAEKTDLIRALRDLANHIEQGTIFPTPGGH